MTLFDACLAVILKEEGGYQNVQADPGNWTGGRVGEGELRGTNFGISAASYPTIDIAALTVNDAAAIYRRDFWTPIAGDELPPPLALLMFDAAVNNGVGRAIRWLQAALAVTLDGVMGPATLAAVRARETHRLCANTLTQRLIFMASLPTWKTFAPGWANRLCTLPFTSLTLETDHA